MTDKVKEHIRFHYLLTDIGFYTLINLDEKQSKGTRWVLFVIDRHMVKYFASFGAE